MRSIEATKQQYPEANFRPLLITEVTRMHGEFRCVAAWDLYGEKIVRPLLSGGEYWRPIQNELRWCPGRLLNVVATHTVHGVPPHRRENLIVNMRPLILDTWEEPELYNALINTSHTSVVSAFGQALIENKYVIEGTDCPSLGGVRIERRWVGFMEDGYNRLRFRVDDNDGRSYLLPVTSDFLLEMFAPGNGMYGMLEANEWLEVNRPTQEIILRLGFARGWAGKDDAWSPKRCYLQLNGIICPADNFHIFAGPPRPR